MGMREIDRKLYKGFRTPKVEVIKIDGYDGKEYFVRSGGRTLLTTTNLGDADRLAKKLVDDD